MAVILVQKNVTTETASGTTAAVTLTSITSGDVVIVGGAGVNSRTITGVTDDKSNTYTTPSGGNDPSSAAGTLTTDMYYCLAPAASAGTVTITVQFSGAAGTDSRNAWVMLVRGLTSPALDVAGQAINSVSGTIDSGPSLTTTGTEGFAMAIACTDNGISGIHAGNEFTIGDIASGTSNASAYLIYSTAAAHQAQWDDSTPPNLATSMICIKSVSGGNPITWLPVTRIVRGRRISVSASGMTPPEN